MPRARKHLVCVSDTPFYHVTSRCVRRAFLCGDDHYSGKSYEHRRDWIDKRLRVLSSLFSIRLCAYAVMSNHYHLVVHLNPKESKAWSNDEVLNRWSALFRGPLLVQHYLAGKALSPAELGTLDDICSVYRQRLGSLSWFMKCLNEHIARKANAEDRCTGHFWEARFHSQALRTETALISAMAYVDLNPIRANMAKTLESSKYTSVRSRITNTPTNSTLAEAVRKMVDAGELQHPDIEFQQLIAFADEVGNSGKPCIPMNKLDYLALVDATGRISRSDKRGSIPSHVTLLLNRLGFTQKSWQEASASLRQHHRNGKLKRTSG